jgi:putative membrane protein
MRRFELVLALALAGGGVAMAEQPRDKVTPPDKVGMPDKAALSPNDREFVHKAAIGGLAEVKLAKMALDKGQSTEVKQFARRMLADHSKANTELKQIADRKHVDVPTALDNEHQAVADKLAKLNGADFDKEYMKAMVDDHNTDVKEFRSFAQGGNDADLKQFAMKTLPVLEHHDDMAKSGDKAMDKMKMK